MADNIDFPDVLEIRNFDMWPAGSSRRSVGLSGRSQIVGAENRVWQGQVSFAPVSGSEIAAFTVFIDLLNGMENTFDLPVPVIAALEVPTDDAGYQAFLGYSAAEIAAGEQLWSDGTAWSDGTGWALPVYSGIMARNDVAAGAQRISTKDGVGRLVPVGSFFSHDGFLYRLTSSRAGVWRFVPPLRSAVTAGDALEIDVPTIRVRLADDGQGQMPLEMGYLVREITLDLIEVFDR